VARTEPADRVKANRVGASGALRPWAENTRLPPSPKEEREVLVLTRHVHQSIVIGQDVVVTVLEVRGDQVRLGIKAPKDVQVHREEVFAALAAADRPVVLPDNVVISTEPGPTP
jgi:carbon storage regulator